MSHCRERHTVELAVQVKRIDIGHGRNMVKHSLHLSEEVGRVDIILARYFRQQQTRVIELGIAHRVYEFLEQESHNLVTSKLDVYNMITFSSSCLKTVMSP